MRMRERILFLIAKNSDDLQKVCPLGADLLF